MINWIIQFALRERLLILVAATILIVVGLLSLAQVPIDVLPDITRPRVAIMTECPGLAPEEVEALVTMPLEMALSGAHGVDAIRSSSDIGLSVIQVEFDWDQDIYLARQIVQERLASVQTQFVPKLAPNSTLLGQIMMIGMWSRTGDLSPMDIRTEADWSVRRRLMQIPGVAQVITMGGERQQFQVLVDPHQMHQFDVSLDQVIEALSASNSNVAGGYFDVTGQELLIRGIGRIRSVREIEQVVVKRQPDRSILIENVARVTLGGQLKRGDASVNGRNAVVLTVQKQPGTDTRKLTRQINEALVSLRDTLPADIRLQTTYEQSEFIDYSVGNVAEAIRDGTFLVVIVLIVFLLNARITLITLTAIPLSLLVTVVIFRYFDLSINVMTLGGIAVALGELVDDAIVDVENIFRRLKDNAAKGNPRAIIDVIFDASVEVRRAIINSTIIVILVFLPLFFLSGVEGRLFTPLGVAYIVSIIASTIVSLTVTPVLSYFLLGTPAAMRRRRESPILVLSKHLMVPIVRLSLTKSGFATASATFGVLLLISGIAVWQMGKDFLPPFDEGATQANLFLPGSASLESSKDISRLADRRLRKLLLTDQNPDGIIRWFTCKNGRAEDDEHVMGVNVTEYTLSLNKSHNLSKIELEQLLFDTLKDIPGVEVEIEQPVAHLIGHMLSGVSAEIGVKIYGRDLGTLRRLAESIKLGISEIDGLTPPIIEQQQFVRQLRIEKRADKYAKYGLTTDQVNRLIETAFRGTTVGQVMVDQRTFDLRVMFDDPWRSDLERLERLPIELPGGLRLPLSEIAHIYNAAGPNTIRRENTQRLISIRVNTMGRDLESAVYEIQQMLDRFEMPAGYYAEIGGQMQAQRSAMRAILLFSGVAFIGIIAVLYANFRSGNLVLQILLAVPAGFIGGALALIATGQSLSVAAMVGFISLGGIAIRNGILLIEAYQRREKASLNLTANESQLDAIGIVRDSNIRDDFIIQGSLDRLAPVLMTTLTTAFALLPLVATGTLPGKELLYPVAAVIVGGLISSTIVEFVVRPGLYRYLAPRRQPDLPEDLNPR